MFTTLSSISVGVGFHHAISWRAALGEFLDSGIWITHPVDVRPKVIQLPSLFKSHEEKFIDLWFSELAVKNTSRSLTMPAATRDC